MHIRRRAVPVLFAAVLCALLGVAAGGALAQSTPSLPLEQATGDSRAPVSGAVRPPENAATNAPMQPGVPRERDAVPPLSREQIEALRTQGINSDASIWAEIRAGERFTTQASNPEAAFLVQDAGMDWQASRAAGSDLRKYGTMGLFAMLILLFMFYLFRGRVMIEHGRSGRTITRFVFVERFGHWLTAGSFVILAVSGLYMLYGRDLILPMFVMTAGEEAGKAAFAQVALGLKWAHNNVAWAFMLGLVLIFFMWVWHNIPSRIDLVWLSKAGGLLSKHSHPPSRKFNAGQKIIFWGTMILGGSLSLSGLALLFPYELPMFAKTFQILNTLGAEWVLGEPLPTVLSPIEEMQLAQHWHSIVAFAMILMILGHIYIGSVGMEGAFDAMGSGEVDRNWAIEHHGLWVEEVEAREAGRDRPAGGAASTPAE